MGGGKLGVGRLDGSGGKGGGIRERTVFYVGVFDLLEDFGPDGCVAFLVLVDARGAEVEPLADAAGALVC